MIEARGLGRSFGRTQAIHDVSFNIRSNEIVGFIGPNGAGKSTTMRILAGVLSPSSGCARIGGHDIVGERAKAQSLLGYMPEAIAGSSELTVRAFLTYCGEARGLSTPKHIQEISMRTALTPALNKPMRTLSKGWRQRAWFAQAVIHTPPALILDEPTDGLDPGQKFLIRSLIRELSHDTAIILSSHILEEIEAICTRVIVLTKGRIRADAAVTDLVDRKGRLASAFTRFTNETA